MKKFIKNNREKLLVIIAGLILVVTFICATYAYYYFEVDKKSLKKTIDVESECVSLNMVFYGLYQASEGAVPIHDRKAIRSNNYGSAVRVRNSCSEDTTFSLGLVFDSSTTIPLSALKYASYEQGSPLPETGSFLVDREAIPLSAGMMNDLSTNSYYRIDASEAYPVYTGSVPANGEVYINIPVWIDYYEGDRTQTVLNNNTTIDGMFLGNVILLPYAVSTAKAELQSVAQDTLPDGESGLLKDATYGDRYIGSDPSNYVLFNCDDYANPTDSTCEKWRIIGIESINGKELIKIVRSSNFNIQTGYGPLDAAYDVKASGVGGTTSSTGDGVWSRSQLMMTLNPEKYIYSAYKVVDGVVRDASNNYIKRNPGAYYYSETAVGCTLYMVNKSGKCSESETLGDLIDFSSEGLKNSRTEKTKTDKMIQEVTIYSPLVTSLSDLSQMYTKERQSNSYIWTGKVVLPYLSDYALASANSSIALRNSCLTSTISNSTSSSFYTNKCFNRNNWLGLTIPLDNTGSAYYYPDTLKFNVTKANNTPSVFKPTVYLNEKVYFTGGDGSSSNPYTINL